MNDFKEFVLINMAFDLILIVAMSYLLGKHMPRFFGFLLICNILPYFLLLPLTDIPGMKSKGKATPGYFELLDVARRPENIIGKNNVPAPRGQVPELLKAFEPPSSEIKLDESIKEDPTPTSEPFFARWQKALRHDPYALWIFLRLFWTAGALVIFFQRPLLGSGLAALQLIPLPFLTYAVPYGALYLVSQPSFAKIGQKLNDPSEIWDLLTPRIYSILATIGGVILVIGAVGLMVVVSRRLAPKRILIQAYLDPQKYSVILNGNLLPFEVKGSQIYIEGIPFDCKNLAVDSHRPNIWILGSNTRLEFVKKR